MVSEARHGGRRGNPYDMSLGPGQDWALGLFHNLIPPTHLVPLPGLSGSGPRLLNNGFSRCMDL